MPARLSDNPATDEEDPRPVAIIGAGIAGLVLALELHRVGVPCQVYEAAPKLQPLGVGINLLPHASEVLSRLGLEEKLTEVAVVTEEAAFFNRYGQLIHREPTGKHAGYTHAQFSIHRGDLHTVLLEAVRERLGKVGVLPGHKVTSVEDLGDAVRLQFDGGRAPVTASIAVACDGVHSVVRKQLYPEEGEPKYSGVMMWRGTAVLEPILSGASMIRAGWLTSGKLVIYPIRNNVDGQGRQLINWVAELETPQRAPRDWSRRGHLEDFADAFSEWKFDWLDVPAMLASSESILEYPMVDQEPLPRWTFGRITLMGDAAHPMVPRGSNGAGQAILDAHALAEKLAAASDYPAALTAYEAERLPATTRVVLTNRKAPPDTIIREVWERTNDQPFADIRDVISAEELAAISNRYKQVAGYSLDQLVRDDS